MLAVLEAIPTWVILVVHCIQLSSTFGFPVHSPTVPKFEPRTHARRTSQSHTLTHCILDIPEDSAEIS
ncbi:hypothetical protein BDW69DRAFT_163313 [Aspergillus filifer]